jgi:hypothetical protein
MNAGQGDWFVDKILAYDAAECFLNIVVPGLLVTLKFQARFPQTRVDLQEQSPELAESILFNKATSDPAR